ncbi:MULTISPECIES: pentapeptide repeat-containing protein [unclassified Paenibacillus]|jgi:hypothetical protein|uniref:pentapeptide repeat-containing protein n=1 Tax=unclassified Paenibacillus TaxID=185978 RepID=UPI00083973A9|nr:MULTISPECIES: pentapeptide repeat-containing protein [unclassified Paenibacillus]SDW40062.1 Pentapeptide repeat-containing protein [Paenibacillus sp. PDC88]
MGRGKSDRKRKQASKRKQKRKAGKIIRFVLANSKVKYRGCSNKYAYQTNIHNLIYKDANFQNVNYRASIITKCNFRNANLEGVEFIYTNLRGSSFKGAKLTDVIFFGCNLKDVDFEKASFDNVHFINSNIREARNLDPDANVRIMSKYPELRLEFELAKILYDLSSDENVYKYHTLHVNKKKFNMWFISLLLQGYSQAQLTRGLRAILRRENKRGFYTVYSYKKFLKSYLKV